jgi:hypothetical protein
MRDGELDSSISTTMSKLIAGSVQLELISVPGKDTVEDDQESSHLQG